MLWGIQNKVFLAVLKTVVGLVGEYALVKKYYNKVGYCTSQVQNSVSSPSLTSYHSILALHFLSLIFCCDLSSFCFVLNNSYLVCLTFLIWVVWARHCQLCLPPLAFHSFCYHLPPPADLSPSHFAHESAVIS